MPKVDRAMAFDAGCNDFIRDPFLSAALAEVALGHFRALDRSSDDWRTPIDPGQTRDQRDCVSQSRSVL